MVRALFVMPFETHAHGPQTTQNLVGVVGRTADPERDIRLMELLPMLGVGRNRSHQDVGMAGWIFRRCVDRDIGTEDGGRGAAPWADGREILRTQARISELSCPPTTIHVVIPAKAGTQARNWVPAFG